MKKDVKQTEDEGMSGLARLNQYKHIIEDAGFRVQAMKRSLGSQSKAYLIDIAKKGEIKLMLDDYLKILKSIIRYKTASSIIAGSELCILTFTSRVSRKR